MDFELPKYANRPDGPPITVGDRGACTVTDGTPGTVIGLTLRTNEFNTVPEGWLVTILWPNHTVTAYGAGAPHDYRELFWVEPTMTVEVELTQDLLAELRAIDPGTGADLLDPSMVADLLDALTEAAHDHG